MTDIEEQAIQRIRTGRRVNIEFESGILEFETPELFFYLQWRLLAFTLRQESHEAVAVMPGGGVLNQLTRQVADCPEQGDPRQQFRVAGFVKLCGCHVQQR